VWPQWASQISPQTVLRRNGISLFHLIIWRISSSDDLKEQLKIVDTTKLWTDHSSAHPYKR
jgi:hypothetical protein